jgi:hypothetical protein
MSNGPADNILNVMKDVLWNVWINKAVQDFLTNKLLSFLIKFIGERFAGILLGPMGWLATILFEYVGGILYKHGKDFINIEAIALLDEKAYVEYSRSSASLTAIARSEGIDSIQFKEAEIEAKKAFSNFIKFGVAR